MKRSRKILIYKLCCVVFAAVLLFVPQRGMPYSDIRVLATVLGVDGSDGNVSVSAQLAIPVAQGSDGKASTVAKATGGSIGEALENLEIGLGRRVDYGHLTTVAIGQDVLLPDLKMFTGYLLSSGKAGPGTYLVHCPQSSAADFLEGAQDMGESSDAELSSFISFSKSGNHVSTTTLLRFLQTLNSNSHATYLPCVALEEENTQTEGGDTQSGGGQKEEEQGAGGGQKSGGAGEQQGSGQKKKLMAANKVSVFGGESVAAVVLDEVTTQGIVWQDRYSDFGLVELRNMQLDGTDIPSVSARLVGKKVRTTATVAHGENVLTYKMKIKLRLDDSQICGNPLFYVQWKNTLEQAYESAVQNSVMLSVQAAKEHNIDFLGMREHFHKFCRKGFETFDLASVVVKTDVTVRILT